VDICHQDDGPDFLIAFQGQNVQRTIAKPSIPSSFSPFPNGYANGRGGMSLPAVQWLPVFGKPRKEF
jgi:hypothetical protein